MQSRSRIASSEIRTNDGEFRVVWITGDYPVELQVPEQEHGVYQLTPEEAYGLGRALVEHAVDSGYIVPR